MKKLVIICSMVLGISVSVNAQSDNKKDMSSDKKMEMKEHVCTDACKKAGHCVYAHGEKGHVCTAECKAMEAKDNKMELKDHVCTAACKDGKHVYAHGEKGHVCTEACKKKM